MNVSLWCSSIFWVTSLVENKLSIWVEKLHLVRMNLLLYISRKAAVVTDKFLSKSKQNEVDFYNTEFVQFKGLT